LLSKHKLFQLIGFVCFSILLINGAYSKDLDTKDSKVMAAHKSPIQKVMLVIAMDAEAEPIISSLKLHKLTHPFSDMPMQGYVGNYGHFSIFLITNGQDPGLKISNVGTQAATLTTYIGIQYFHPDLIINIGTAGGVEQNGVKLREIYVSEKIYFYDRRIMLEKYDEYGLGGYPSAQLAYKKIDIKPGIVCSGDSFDNNQTDYDIFIKQNCSAVDMEAAGVAWVSMLAKIPMFAIKGITNFVRGNDIHRQYEENYPIVTLTLSQKLEEILKLDNALLVVNEGLKARINGAGLYQ